MKRRIAVAIFAAIIFLTNLAVAQQESNDFSYALKLYNEGFYDIAVQQWSNFVSRYPNSERQPEARYYLGDALQKLGEIDNARIEFQALAVSYPDHQRAPQAWYRVGECYELAGKYEEAAKAFETVKILYPEHSLAPKALLKAADALVKVQQYTRAEQVVREFLNRYATSADYPRGRVLYGKILYAKGEPERANNEFENVLRLTTDLAIQAEAKMGQAVVFKELGFSGRAKELLVQIVQTNAGTPTGFQAVTMLAELLLDGKQFDEVVALLKREIDRYKATEQNEKIRLLLSQAYFMLKDYFQSRTTAEALRNSKNNELAALASFYVASCLLEEKRFSQAESAYNALLESPSETDLMKDIRQAAMRNLILLQIEKGDLSAARNALTKYQNNFSTSETVEPLHRTLVQMAFRNNQPSAGIDELQRYRGAFPNSNYRDELLFEAAKAFYRSEQYERSRQLFQQIVDEYTTSAVWDSSRIFLEHLNIYYSQNQNNGVKELARLMGEMLSGVERKTLLFKLGKLYLRELKDFAEAARTFESYLATTTDSAAAADGWYLLNESYLRLLNFETFHNPTTETTSGYAAKYGESIKKAMMYRRYCSAPDTLTYRFLQYTASLGKILPQEFVKYWQVFEDRYPNSQLLPEVRLQLAEAHQSLGNTDNAIALLSKIKGTGLVAGTAAWRKAELLQQSGKIDEAIQLYKDFLFNYPKHPYQAKGYAWLANYYQAKGDYGTAAQFWDRLANLFDYADEAVQAKYLAVENFIRNGDDEKALSYLLPQVQKYRLIEDPVLTTYLPVPQPESFFYTGSAKYRQNDFTAARKYLLQYLKMASAGEKQSETLFLLGKMAYSEGDKTAALLQFELIKKSDNPEVFFQALSLSADILFEEKKYAEALQKYNLLISENPTSPQLVHYEGQKLRCMVNLNHPGLNQAVAAFKQKYGKMAEGENYLAAVEYEQAKLDFSNKNFDKSINHCKTILNKYKKSEFADDAQYLIGRNYIVLNKTDKAMGEFEKFLKNYPKSDLTADVFLAIAEIHFRKDETESGVSAVRRALEEARNPATEQKAMASLINTYKSLQLWDGALQYAREYVRKFPNAPDVIDQKINIGVALIRLNRYSEAVDYLKELKFEVSSDQEPEVQFYIGEAYFNGGQYDQAINEFVKIPLLSQKTKLQWEASALYYAGQSYEKMGKVNEAIRMYQEIIDRPGIQLELKRQAKKLIDNLKNMN
jgi:tol-pal system protein YbgF